MAQSSSTLRNHMRGIVLTVPWVLYLFLADTVLSLLLPLKLFSPRFVYDASSQVARSVWACIQLIFTRANGAHISISGDALPRGESAIVVSNHVAWSDFYLIQALAMKAGMLGRCRYFAKAQLRFVPFLGWGLWAMGMPLVSRNWLRDKSELDHVFSNMVQKAFPTWLISFSEGTRFTPAKYQESIDFCKLANRRQPRNLLYPRTKGFIATVQHLRQAPHVKAVYDLTIAYQHQGTFQRAPSMWETLSTPGLSEQGGYKFHVHVRRFPIESLPAKDEELAAWLEELWMEKGKILEAQEEQWLDR
ncbi:PlsC domain-containing protein [Fusarium sp. Ph1]|nr:PlsC domain-containing protein [Fusarium sp. Ph1]